MSSAVSRASRTWLLQSQNPTIQSQVQPVANNDTPREDTIPSDDLTHVAAFDLHSRAFQGAGSLESGIIAQTAGGHGSFGVKISSPEVRRTRIARFTR